MLILIMVKTQTQKNNKNPKNQKENKMTKREIEELITADEVSKTRDGHFIARKSFFYRHGENEDKFAARIKEQLKSEGVETIIIDRGEIWRVFKGSASIKTQSHWWVKFLARKIK